MRTFEDYYKQNWKFDGMSAKCIYGVHTNNRQENYHPYDPDDLTRCFQCLRFITNNENITDWKLIIAKVVGAYPESKYWASILKHFEGLHKLYFYEYKTNKMKRTYAYMEEIGL